MPKFEYPVDSEKDRIYEDDVVAFNRSGSVIRGVVVGIKPRTDGIAKRCSQYEWGYIMQWVITIECSDGKVSEVKNTDGILVIG